MHPLMKVAFGTYWVGSTAAGYAVAQQYRKDHWAANVLVGLGMPFVAPVIPPCAAGFFLMDLHMDAKFRKTS